MMATTFDACFYPRPPRWRGLLAPMERGLAGIPATLRADLATRPCAWCPPTPAPEAVTRPCMLCQREYKGAVQSPGDLTVNGEPACSAHYLEVSRLRGLMRDADRWNQRLTREQAEAERAEREAARAYHRRRAIRSMENVSL